MITSFCCNLQVAETPLTTKGYDHKTPIRTSLDQRFNLQVAETHCERQRRAWRQPCPSSHSPCPPRPCRLCRASPWRQKVPEQKVPRNCASSAGRAGSVCSLLMSPRQPLPGLHSSQSTEEPPQSVCLLLMSPRQPLHGLAVLTYPFVVRDPRHASARQRALVATAAHCLRTACALLATAAH